jgi:hypothetical protein
MSISNSIEYIRPDIPHVEITPYRGRHYDDLVPDTLDLAERLNLAINGVTGTTDPAADYEQYFWSDFFHNPPVMTHDFSDWCQCKVMESLPLMRSATGSDLNSQVDRVWMDALLKSIGPDGLFYIPMRGRLWSRTNVYGRWPIIRADGSTTTIEDESVTQFAHVFTCGRILGAMTVHYLRDRNPLWKGLAERMVDRLAELAIDRGDYCYFPMGAYEPNARFVDTGEPMPLGGFMVDFGGGRLAQGLAQYYKATGYEPAIRLAGKLARAVVDHSGMYDADGRFLLAEPPKEAPHIRHGGHFHSNTIVLLSLLEYAMAANDHNLVDFVRRSYEWARRQGSLLTGVYPTVIFSQNDQLAPPYYDEFEICELADMIALALKLSEAGACPNGGPDGGDYYDDAERWARNHFAEGQLTRCDWIDRKPRYMDRRPIFPYETEDRVAERNVGAFGGWMTGGDWASRMGVMHCCTGNATRTLFYLWEHAVTHAGNALRVNMRLNHASRWADVHSSDPYEGRVDVTLKVDCAHVRVHAPEWVESGSGSIACRLNGEPRALAWAGRYVDAGAAAPGDCVSITYPLTEYETKELLIDTLYTLTVKGNTVVAIDPPGRHCPLYQRAHYRQPEARWRKVARFVPDEVPWW